MKSTWRSKIKFYNNRIGLLDKLSKTATITSMSKRKYPQGHVVFASDEEKEKILQFCESQKLSFSSLARHLLTRAMHDPEWIPVAKRSRAKA